ncbi:hypothetical protein C453_06918 [Haloferax elongans ATCC BAA-1513]|uniref:Uncharacterized protein n=1 Tax=Haloferax elongans ATCC BAA-1513 TaxID=1230453 RepID=M0HPB4_HALEO|nr:hypothetical protein [Haloferax elongans]ELZ85527.1 hypothetical protein C453_06918 [Haloferax elongans ATCC BAA-1513]
MGTFSLIVPEDEQTIEIGKACYRFHIDHSQYDSDKSPEELRDYRNFKEKMNENERFMVYEKASHTIVDAAEPPIQHVFDEYRDDEFVVHDSEGLSRFVEALEAARENLDSDGGIIDVRDRKIEKCINIILFARENNYGISYS